MNDALVEPVESQKELPFYIGIYLWEDYSAEDFYAPSQTFKGVSGDA